MEPQAPMPWRVLESPPLDGEQDGPPSDQIRRRTGTQPSASTSREPSVGPSAAPRALAIGAGAVVCAVVAFVLATGSGSGSADVEGGSGSADRSQAARSSTDPVGDTSPAPSGDLVVEIVGAVRQPGVYRLPRGSRVGDLLTAAGGYGPRVDTARAERELNLAATLSDGAQIRVPSRDDVSAGAGGGAAVASGPVASDGATVDLNRATKAELEALPGIGPATAQKILAARDEAPFASVDELRSRGILGEKTFEKLRSLVSVG
jgi:competence protein ComEA